MACDPSPPSVHDDPLGAPVGIVGQALLDALPARAAVLDRSGTVVATNAAWREVNWPGPINAGLCEGHDIVTALRATLAPTPVREAARQLADGVERILSGEAQRWERVTDGAGPVPGTWHTMQVFPLAVPHGGVL